MSDSLIRPFSVVAAAHLGRLDFNDNRLSPLDVFCAPTTDPLMIMLTDCGGFLEPSRVVVDGHISHLLDPQFRQHMQYERRLNVTDSTPGAPYSMATASVGNARISACTFTHPTCFPTTDIILCGPGDHNQTGHTESEMHDNGLHTVTVLGPYRVSLHTCYDEETGAVAYAGAIHHTPSGDDIPYHISTLKAPGSTATERKDVISGHVGGVRVDGHTFVTDGKIEVERTIGPYQISQVIRQEYRYPVIDPTALASFKHR